MDLFNGYNPGLARLVIRNRTENLYHFPIICNQCENAYCMNVCPVSAIQRNSSGVVMIDPEVCIACGLCAQYCPLGVVVLDPETGKANKCDLCRGEPLCVAACPTGALELIRKDELPQRKNQ